MKSSLLTEIPLESSLTLKDNTLSAILKSLYNSSDHFCFLSWHYDALAVKVWFLNPLEHHNHRSRRYSSACLLKYGGSAEDLFYEWATHMDIEQGTEE